MEQIIKERLFKKKVEKALSLCNEELFLRKHNMSGEGTIEQFEDIIIPELEVLLNLDLLSACKFHRRICLK